MVGECDAKDRNKLIYILAPNQRFSVKTSGDVAVTKKTSEKDICKHISSVKAAVTQTVMRPSLARQIKFSGGP